MDDLDQLNEAPRRRGFSDHVLKNRSARAAAMPVAGATERDADVRQTARDSYSTRASYGSQVQRSADAFEHEIEAWIDEAAGPVVQSTEKRAADGDMFDPTALADMPSARKMSAARREALGEPPASTDRASAPDDLRAEPEIFVGDQGLATDKWDQDGLLEIEPLDDDALDDIAFAEAEHKRSTFGGRARAAVLFSAAGVAALGVAAISMQSLTGSPEVYAPDLATGSVGPNLPNGANAGADSFTPPLSWTGAMKPDAMRDMGLALEPVMDPALPASAIDAGDANSTIPSDDAEISRDEAIEIGAIETGSLPSGPTSGDAVDALGATAPDLLRVSPYLDAGALAELFATRPVRCSLSAQDAEHAQLIGSARDQVLGFGGAGCATTTHYRMATGLYTARSEVDENAKLEINAAFALDGDQLCHDLQGVAVLVTGDGLPLPEAVALEGKVKDSYARRDDDRICYRIRDMSATLGPDAYRADVIKAGVYRADLSDPRPFLMRPQF